MEDKTTDQECSETAVVSRAKPGRLSSLLLIAVLAGVGASEVTTAEAQEFGGYYPGGRSDFGTRHAGPDYAWGEDHYGRSRGHHYSRYPRYPMRSQWLQRPYPYHLDYYKMRYGGSYAPYFGNLYGAPSYVLPPGYYGGVYYY